MAIAREIVDRLASERPLLRVMDDKLERVFQDREPETVDVDWTGIEQAGKVKLLPVHRTAILYAMMNFHQVTATDFSSESDEWVMQPLSERKVHLRMQQYLHLGKELYGIYDRFKTLLEDLDKTSLPARLHVLNNIDPEELLNLMKRLYFALAWLGIYAEQQATRDTLRKPGKSDTKRSDNL